MSKKSSHRSVQECKDERLFNSVRGTVLAIDIHEQRNIFKLQTSFPETFCVECEFTDDLLETVKESLGCSVSVQGECFYRQGDRLPYMVNIRMLEILPPSEDLPSLEDLHGIAPNATGDKSPEEFVREMRNEWDKRLDRWR